MDSLLSKHINVRPSGPSTYTVSAHPEWAVGFTIHGGAVAAQLHRVASTHMMRDASLAKLKQPDILALHVDFLRPCALQDSSVTVTTLKAGVLACTLRLELFQRNKLHVVASVTTTNFDRDIGPSADTKWSLSPPPPPKPDFAKILAQERDENWMIAVVKGEVFPLTARKPGLVPRRGLTADNVVDFIHYFPDERIDNTHIALLADLMPSMSDTLTRNGALWDMHKMQAVVEAWDSENPGKVCRMTNTLDEMMDAKMVDLTATLDVEFKRRLTGG